MNVEVTKDEVKILESSDLPNENEYKITTCYFTFDEFTSSFQVKRAIFTILSTGEMYETDIINDECNIPIEVLKKEYERVKIGVYGYNIGENEELLNRFSPSYDEFIVPTGSYEEGALTPEPITPSQYDMYSQALQEGLDTVDDKLDEVVETVDDKLQEVDDKLEEVDTTVSEKITEIDDKLQEVDNKLNSVDDRVDDKIDEVDGKIAEVNTAITETNNLDLDVSDKVDGDVTVTLTKKDASTKSVTISDGTSLQFMWQGTSLGIKTEDMEDYVFVDLQGQVGPMGPQGNPFQVKKTYATINLMIADYDNMEINDYVMISGNIEEEDNAKLFVKTEQEDPVYRWQYLADFSGASGVVGPTGATPNIQIGTVTSGSTPSVTRTGTNENPVLNFVLQPGPQGNTGPTGPTGNGIDRIELTATVGAVKTYTIYYTNGNTTTFDVTDGEITQEVFDESQEEQNEEIDRLKMVYNALPSEEATGESITIDGTAEVPFRKMDLKGNTSQYSTTGKNLFDGIFRQGNHVSTTTANRICSDNAIQSESRNYYTLSTNLPNTYKWKIMNCTANGTSITVINDTHYTSSGSVSVNCTTNGYLKVLIGKTDDSNITTSDVSSYHFQIEKGSTATSYEPYTNGASPNPDYPQDIHVVSGDNTIKVEGKNLFDKDNPKILHAWFLQDTKKLPQVSNNDTIVYIPCQPNTTYTCSKMLEPTSSKNTCIVGTTSIEPNFGVAINQAIGWQGLATTQRTITTTNNDKYLMFFCYTVGGEVSQNDMLASIQIEKGSTATTYEPYQGNTYNIDLPVENLFDIATNTNGKVLASDGTITDDVKFTISDYIKVSPSMIYTISWVYDSSQGNDTAMRVGYYQSDKTFISRPYNTTSPYTITTPNNCYYIRICYHLASHTQVQVEKGSKQNSFTPYGTTPMELCKIGDYQDYIYKENGNWYKHEVIKKGNTSSFGIAQRVTSTMGDNLYGYAINVPSIKRDYSDLGSVISNIFVPKILGSTESTTDPNNVRFNQGISKHSNHSILQIVISINKSYLTTGNVNEVIPFLNSKDFIFYFLLQTPTEVQITDTTLINQLNNLEKAYSYDEQTNISQVNNDLPFIITAEAILSLKNILNI